MDAATMLFEIETRLLENIAGALAQDSRSDGAYWKTSKLRQIAALKSLNERAIFENFPAAVEAARKEIREAALKAARDADAMIEDAEPGKLSDALPPEADSRIYSVWDTWENATADTLDKLAVTLLDESTKGYARIIERATAEALTGASTLREAIADSAMRWADMGIPALIDKGGRPWTIEAYSQVVIRSNIRRVVTETQDERIQNAGFDLVVVSSHIGARPLCAPYQGRVFSLSGKTPGYPNLYADTSYGEAAGLFGCNCGHRFYLYVPGTRKAYSPYNEEENDRVYEESQRQRALERGIRKAARVERIAKQLGDQAEINKAARRAEKAKKAMAEFIKDTGRTRRRDREQIYDGGTK